MHIMFPHFRRLKLCFNYFFYTFSGELDGILNPTGVLRLDHRHIKYGSTNITLAWKIINSTCTNSRVLSYDECNSDTPNINITTEDRITILPSTDLRTASGDLADFSISSYSNQQQDCPMLISAVRFNGNGIIYSVMHVYIYTITLLFSNWHLAKQEYYGYSQI